MTGMWPSATPSLHSHHELESVHCLTSASWAFSFLWDLVHSSHHKLPFCGPHEINHFFCEIHVCPQVGLCRYLAEPSYHRCIPVFAFLVRPLCLVLGSYVRILDAILRIQSAERAWERLSPPALPPLREVGLFFGTAIVLYMTPRSSHSQEQRKILSLFYNLFNLC